MQTPAVSILCPLRNEARFLPAMLTSLFRQTLRDWELVAVDDGSTDDTPQLLAAAAAQDPRIRIITLPPSGLVAALNTGLTACQAPLVARCDGDDICHAVRLEKQVHALVADPRLDLVACRVRHFPRPGLGAGMRAYEAWQNTLLDHEAILRDLFVESPFAHPSVVYRRQPVLAIGAYRDTGWAEDYDLWLRMAADGARFRRLPETLLFWRDRPERLTRTAANCSAAAFRAARLHFLIRGFLCEERSVILWGAGKEGKAWRRDLNAAGIAVRAWLDVDPRKIGQTLHGAPVRKIDSLGQEKEKILVTVGAKGARAEIRAYADARGLREGRDYLCVT